jgi:hypothetical protein
LAYFAHFEKFAILELPSLRGVIQLAQA